MYSSFFHMKENPFAETPNIRFFFTSRTHLRALDSLKSAVEAGRAFALVTGEVGFGKTLLSRILIRILESQKINTGLILHPIYNQEEILAQIAKEFGLPETPRAQFTLKGEMDKLVRFFLETAKAGRKSVIIIDEAHKLSFEALEILGLFTNLETESEKIVQVVLLAQPEILKKLEAHHLRQIKQRIGAPVAVLPLSVQETKKYVTHRLSVAGGDNFVRFDDRAIQMIFERSGGAPRMINFYAELALSTARNQQQRFITKDLLLEAIGTNNEITFFQLIRRFFAIGPW